MIFCNSCPQEWKLILAKKYYLIYTYTNLVLASQEEKQISLREIAVMYHVSGAHGYTR